MTDIFNTGCTMFTKLIHMKNQKKLTQIIEKSKLFDERSNFEKSRNIVPLEGQQNDTSHFGRVA